MKTFRILCALTLAANAAAEMPEIKLPPGFHIEIYADDLPGARTLRLGEQGTLFVSTRDKGVVYALSGANHDGRPDRRYRIAEGLNMPNGIAFRDRALYVAEVDRILKFPDIERALTKPPVPQIIRADLPRETHHGWRYIGFGPDGKLYVSIGAPCNVCQAQGFKRGHAMLEYASITRMNADGSDWEVFARGVRNSVGFDWQPQTGELWFTDNGRDWLGDNQPSCELNRAPHPGLHFGFPYCHAGKLPDPEFGRNKSCADYTPPARNLGAHVAPLGLRFYTGIMFPPEYRNQIFVAEHGSWNRSRKTGYTLNLLRLREGRVISDEPFASGWLTQGFFGQEKVSGRPVDVLVMPDGALLVSDDHAGRIYRIYYKP